MPKVNSKILTAAGEHYAASFLSAIGLAVGLTRQGVPFTDLIVTSPHAGRSLSIQVKSGGKFSQVCYKKKPENDYWVWRVGKNAQVVDKYYWYAFVYVGTWPTGEERPEIFFVPSLMVARTTRGSNNKEWYWVYKSKGARFQGMKGAARLKKALQIVP